MFLGLEKVSPFPIENIFIALNFPNMIKEMCKIILKTGKNMEQHFLDYYEM